MKYLKKFETASEIQDWQISDEHATPNVVLAGDTGDIRYNVPKLFGVFIQHVDGNVYTIEDWTFGGFGNEQANGVAVIAEECRFVIAKEDISTSMDWASSTATLAPGVFTTTDSNTAKTDYAGPENTNSMRTIDANQAGYSCANYTFPNGKPGYLPALGEWTVALANKSEIITAMALIGGEEILSSSYYWSSTQYSTSKAWLQGWETGWAGPDSKNGNWCVRAFSSL